MRPPKNLKYFTIKNVGGLITNVDRPDLPSNFAIKTIGMRHSTPGYLAERDNGTIHRHKAYPIRPNAHKLVEDASNETPIKIKCTGHGFSTGDTISVAEVRGNRNANGTWIITKIDADYFTLDNSVGNGDYTEGGICSDSPISMVKHHPLYYRKYDSEFDVVCGVSSDGKTRLYYCEDPDLAKWVEITRTLTATIDTVEGGSAQKASGSFEFGSPILGDYLIIDTLTFEFGYDYLQFGTISELVDLVNLISSTVGASYDGTTVTITAKTAGTSGNDIVLNGHWPQALPGYLSGGSEADQQITITDIKDDLGNATTISLYEIRNWIVINNGPPEYPSDKGSGVVIWNDDSSIVTDIDPTVTGLGWEADDVLVLYATTGTYHVFNFQNGTYPHVQWRPVTPERKLYFFYGRTGFPTEANQSLLIQRNESRGYFYNANVPLITLTTDFDMNMSGGLIPDYQSVGSEYGPVGATTGSEIIYDPTGIPVFKILYTVSLASAPGQGMHRKVAITVLYQDGGESDPIFRIFATGGADHILSTDFSIHVNFANMNKNIKGFGFYCADKLVTDCANFTEWIDDADEYIYVGEMLTQSQGDQNWGKDTTDEFPYYAAIALGSSPQDENYYGTLLGNLNHVPDYNRSYIESRYVALVRSTEASARIFVDQNDKFIRGSLIDGYGANQDGNFPDQTVGDVEAGAIRFKYVMNGIGPLYGLAQAGDQLIAFRAKEAEIFDIQSGVSKSIVIDCIAPESIILTPYGLVWAGTNAIYLLTGIMDAPKILNTDWINLYNGNVQTSIGTPRITNEAKVAIVAGYDYRRNQALFTIEVAKEYQDPDSDTLETEFITFRTNFQ
jgi:hypothetical protein